MKALGFRRGNAWRLLSLSLVCTMCVAVLPGVALGSLTPDTLKTTLHPGESVTEHKVVHVPSTPPKADIIFAFDCTGSMGGTLDDFKTQADAIMSDLKAIPGTDFTFAVSSHDDYPHAYDSYGYSEIYGSDPDYAYKLNQPLTADTSAVSSAISTLTVGGGMDGPEDYTRILYESYADTNVGWRPGARRIIVDFGDIIPHDNNINQGLLASPAYSTGGDPGRDEVMFTADDLDLQSVLTSMTTNNVTLLRCTPSYSWNDVIDFASALTVSQYWDYWSGLTGGSQFEYDPSNPASFTPNVVDAVTKGLTQPTVSGLHLELSPGYASFAPWLTSLNPATASGSTDHDYSFDVTYTVPPATAAGEYTFKVRAIDDAGVVYGEQTVDITVPSVATNPDSQVGISVTPTSVSSGGLATWTVTEKNTGDATLTAPFVNVNNANTDAAGVKKLDASSPNFTGDDGDGLLGPKETWQWTFTENPTVDEHYWAFGHGMDPAGLDVSVATGHPTEQADATLTIQVKAHPDTVISIKSNPTQVVSGGLVTWTVSEKNTGNVDLAGAYVNVSKDCRDNASVARLDNKSATYSSSNGTVDTTLAAGETWTWTLTSNPTACVTYTANGHGFYGSKDISYGNGFCKERGCASVIVWKACPDTAVTIKSNLAQVASGGLVTWTVSEKNTGNVDLAGVYVNVSKDCRDNSGVAKLTNTSATFSSSNGTADTTLAVGETWTWTLTSRPTATVTYTANGHGLYGSRDISYVNGFCKERGCATVTIKRGCMR